MFTSDPCPVCGRQAQFRSGIFFSNRLPGEPRTSRKPTWVLRLTLSCGDTFCTVDNDPTWRWTSGWLWRSKTYLLGPDRTDQGLFDELRVRPLSKRPDAG